MVSMSIRLGGLLPSKTRPHILPTFALVNTKVGLGPTITLQCLLWGRKSYHAAKAHNKDVSLQ